MNALVEQLTDQMLLANAARKAGLDQQPAVQLALENQARAVLASAYMDQAGRQADHRRRGPGGLRRRVSPSPSRSRRCTPRISWSRTRRRRRRSRRSWTTAPISPRWPPSTAPTARPAAAASSAGSCTTRWCPNSPTPPSRWSRATISEPVKSPFGWHIIKAREARAADAAARRGARPDRRGADASRPSPRSSARCARAPTSSTSTDAGAACGDPPDEPGRPSQ